MQDRPIATHRTNVKFSLAFESTRSIGSGKSSQLIASSERLVIALCRELRFPMERVTFTYDYDLVGQVTRIRCSIDFLTNAIASEIKKSVEACLNHQVPILFPQVQVKKNFESEVSSIPADAIQTITLTTQVFEIRRQFNQVARLVEETRSCVLPSDPTLIPKPGEQKFEYNAFRERIREVNGAAAAQTLPILLTPPILPAPVHAPETQTADLFGFFSQPKVVLNKAALLEKATDVIAGDEKCRPFITSILSGNYNQALRRACFAGEAGLVLLLITTPGLELDFNAKTSDGRSPLDLAILSGNKLVKKLIKGRLGFDEDEPEEKPSLSLNS